MLGIIYLALAVLLGKEIVEACFLPRKTSEASRENHFWLVMPAAFGVGTLAMTWGVYIVSWIASVGAGSSEPLFYGNLAVMGFGIAALVLLYTRRIWYGERIIPSEYLVSDKKLFLKETIYFIFLTAGIAWIMFYVFHIRDGILYSGFTVYGDYAPHTAMMRSFSWGNNFPTQYPHFGGSDVKYHFMFQFLAGNLEYLGLRLDFAYNIISIFSLTGFLMVLYRLTVRIIGSPVGGVITAFLFFFRSGLAFFKFAWEHIQAGDFLTVLAENTKFIGYTANENWGLWNFNVYLNQRHLAFGLLLCALSLWVYLDWVEAANAHPQKGLVWFRERLFTKEAWKSRNLEAALMVGMILGLCAFWNGAAVIGCLLILLGFGIFSDGKLDYAVTAVTAVVFSVIQSKIFISGKTMIPSVFLGFLAEEKTFAGVIEYLFMMSGIFFLGFVVLFFLFKRRERIVMISFFFPAVFAFTVSLTPDINVNHKYVMISYAFLAMYWAGALCRLFKKKWWGKSIGLILVCALTFTGIYDFVVIIKDNDARHRVAVNMESPISQWLRENLHKDDLILTPEYSINEVTMSGVMLYCGWPYYAWSAGYNTDYRAEKAVEIYTADNQLALMDTVKQERISYILFQEGMEFEQEECREDIIAMTYPLVYESKDGRVRIYET